MSTTQTQVAPAELIGAINEPGIPQLKYVVAQTNDEKRDALRLVADTIAQQRQVASTTIIFHPAVLGPFVALLAGLLYRSRNDWIGAIILISGITVAYLASVQYYTYGYLQRAENFNWKKFITPSADISEQQDTVMYARYGDNVIAAIVLRLDKAQVSSKKALQKETRVSGGDMLRGAISVARSTLGSTVIVTFSNPHAHTIDTTQFFTAPFQKREMRAQKALAQAIEDAESNVTPIEVGKAGKQAEEPRR
ncbi:hypothetical protein NLG97_g4570 [Lecanicillium saksenae]|uniref:Uncharacterized protein n=1 Tax=Lecanicillium saksenae TaxID=468837 RepID=A0ACC1QY28_9HYPO|nr:hypothetical protein NLG97_g4570 [Lecanicillium saksenae]